MAILLFGIGSAFRVRQANITLRISQSRVVSQAALRFPSRPRERQLDAQLLCLPDEVAQKVPHKVNLLPERMRQLNAGLFYVTGAEGEGKGGSISLRGPASRVQIGEPRLARPRMASRLRLTQKCPAVSGLRGRKRSHLCAATH
jgi:hypothetical protein